MASWDQRLELPERDIWNVNFDLKKTGSVFQSETFIYENWLKLTSFMLSWKAYIAEEQLGLSYKRVYIL